MPTTRPRYTVTDTGPTAELLDLAHEAWPDIADRRQLLLRLAEYGGARLVEERDGVEGRKARQRRGLDRAATLVDVDVLLRDDAWR